MAIPNIWTIAGADGNYSAFSELGLGGVARQIQTQRPDQLRMTQTAPYDADPLFEYGERVTVRRDGVQWFRGTCTSVKRGGTGSAESLQYVISGPWWQLENTIYRQKFDRVVDGAAATPSLAKLILGTDEDGSRLDSGQVISHVVAYAASQLGAAALFQLGTVDPDTQMPYEELQALSCAEVLSRLLRWSPDVVAYFDYATEIPTLHFRRRSNLSTATLSHADVEIASASINPLHQLQRDGVVVQFERTDTVDDNERLVVIEDSAGDTSNPLTTLYLYFDLQGSSLSFNRQRVVSESIQEGSGAWWQKRHPKLAQASSIIVDNELKIALDDGAENDGTEYDKELISGSIADWMLGVGVNAQIITADVSWNGIGGPKKEPLRLQVQGTNADSKIYSIVDASSPAEPTPTGLAAAILDSLSQLQYEGSIRLVQPEAGATPYIARAINIAGGRPEWESMAAQVYSVSENLDSGDTTISIGPAKHLGPDQLFQLYRNTRTRRGSSGAARTSTAGGGRDLPTRSPNTIAADGFRPEESGVLVFHVDGSTTFIPESDIYDGTPGKTNWAIEFPILNRKIDTSVGHSYSELLPRYDGDILAEQDQTFYRLPVLREVSIDGLPERIDFRPMGIYQEDIFCHPSKGPIVHLIRIG